MLYDFLSQTMSCLLISQATLPVELLESSRLELTVLHPTCYIPDSFRICVLPVPIVAKKYLLKLEWLVEIRVN